MYSKCKLKGTFWGNLRLFFAYLLWLWCLALHKNWNRRNSSAWLCPNITKSSEKKLWAPLAHRWTHYILFVLSVQKQKCRKNTSLLVIASVFLLLKFQWFIDYLKAQHDFCMIQDEYWHRSPVQELNLKACNCCKRASFWVCWFYIYYNFTIGQLWLRR